MTTPRTFQQGAIFQRAFDDTPRALASHRRDRLPVLLPLLVVFSSLSLDLYLGPGYPLPNFWGYLLLLTVYLREPETFSANEVKFVALLLLFPSLSLFTYDMAFFVDRLKGYLAYGYSLIFGLLLYKTLVRYSQAVILRSLAVLLVVLFLLTSLERFTPMEAVFAALRESLHPINVYVSDGRDLSMVGFVRPKLLWREPAGFAQFVTLVIWSISILAPRKLSVFLGVLGLTVVAYLMIGSPVLLLAVIGAGAIFLPALIRSTGFWIAALGTLLAVVLASIVLVHDSRTIPIPGAERLSNIIQGDDSSFQKRLGVPGMTALNVLSDHPLFGLGISGTEAGFSYFSEAYGAFGYKLYDDGKWHTKIHSAGLNFLISFGILGSLIYGVCFFFAFGGLIGFSGVVLLAALLAVLQLSMGTYVTPGFWGPIAMLTAFIAVSGSASGSPIAQARHDAPHCLPHRPEPASSRTECTPNP